MNTPRTDKILEDHDFDADNCHDPLVELAKELEQNQQTTEQRLAALEEQVAMLRGFLNI